MQVSSIIDSHAATNDNSDILNHWGVIIRADFERNNPDFQHLKNGRNISKVITALNHIGTAFSSLQNDNIELNRSFNRISTLIEMETQVTEAEIQVSDLERRENVELRGEASALIVSNWELGNKLGRISDWMWMP